MRPLRISTWLILALISVILIPWAAAVALNHLQIRLGEPTDLRVQVINEVENSFLRWQDPQWQESIRPKLEKASLDVMIEDLQGHVVFRTAGNPPVGDPMDDRSISVWVRHVLRGSSRVGTARFWGPPESPTTDSSARWAPLVGGMVALLLTLIGVIWFVRRTVLIPLSAMSRAARRIAANNLDFYVPASHVQEVAEVIVAFRAMGDALRESLHRQAEMEQERRLFISGVAHDLRTPLFSLRGYLEGLEKGVANSPEKMVQYIRICQEKAARLDQMVSDFFNYARLEYLEQAPAISALELGALLRKTAEGMRPQAERKRVSIQLEGDLAPCPLDGDPFMLTRAVENLLDNAIRYTPPGGTVRLNWSREADEAVFRVTDTGPGIDPKDLADVFTALYRGDKVPSGEGAGLGLAIAHRIITAHGGELSAVNVPGGGSQFTARLRSRATPPSSVHSSSFLA